MREPNVVEISRGDRAAEIEAARQAFDHAARMVASYHYVQIARARQLCPDSRKWETKKPPGETQTYYQLIHHHLTILSEARSKLDSLLGITHGGLG